MIGFDLDRATRAVAAAMLPEEVIRQRRVVGSAINPDGMVNPDALRHQFHAWQPVTWYLDGPVVAGTNIGLEYDVLHGGHLRLIRIRAKVAPITSPCVVIVTAGDARENAALPVGWTANSSATGGRIEPQSVMRLDVISGGGAEGLSVVAYYSCTGREGDQ